MSQANENYDEFQSMLNWMERSCALDQQTPSEIAQKLQAAGFTVPTIHPLVALDGSVKDPREDGFEVINTGGFHMALYREYDRFYMQIAEFDGTSFDLDVWQYNVIAACDHETDEELTSVSALKWQLVMEAAAA